MPEKRSVWALLPGIVDRPGATLANIAAYPRGRWLLPAALAVIALIASIALTAPLLAAQTQQAIAAQLNQLPAAQLEQVQTQMALFQSPLFIGGTAAATGILGLLVGWLLQAAFIYFGVLIVGAELDFRRIFATVPWLGLPFMLETSVQAVYSRSQGHLLVNQGLAYLVSSGKALDDARNLAYVALSQVSLFRLWHLLLVYLLFRVAAKFGGGAAFLLTIIYIALGIGGQWAMASLGGMLVPTL